ncbi:MAG: M15 family metallopeptidase [Acidimicrobiales bacterium]
MHSSERGSTLPFIALIIVLVGVIVILLGRLGGAATARAGARNAADAAALAGAAAGRSAADELARANGAELLSFSEIGLETEVRVRLGPAEAVGRARRSGDRDGGGGVAGATKGLAAAMRAALGRAEQLLGRPVPITSGYRSTDAQAQLYANRASNPYPVAPPGSSMHEKGLAVDVPADFVSRLLDVAPKSGLCQPYPTDDPIHFEVCR